MRVVSLGAVLFALALQTAPVRPSTFIPVGVWYGGGTVRAPMMPRDVAAQRDAWRRDLETIKGLGFNSIKAWVDWASVEPREGEFQFAALDQLMTLADEAGLRVIVQIYTDSSPEWVGAAYPDASFVTAGGERIGSQAAPGYCIDHPKVRAAMTRFIRAVGDRARQHRSLYGVDVWSEPHIVNWVWFNEPKAFCYCQYTQTRFRDWLRQKYGTLDALNAAWYRTFHDWDEAEAPRYGTILSYTDLMDWNTFVAAKLRDDLRAKADATGLQGQYPISSHSDAPAVMLSPLSGYGNPDDWWMSDAVDFYGTSLYPRHAAAATPWSPVRLTSALDGIRSAAGDKGWWVGELQAGQGATGVRVATPVTPSDVRLWGWAALSRGARSISYYAYYPMSSGYESNGYGLIDLDGRVTDRAKAAGAFARIVQRETPLLASARPRPGRVAVLYNRLSYLVGGNTVGPGTTVRNSMIGFYRAMFERNIPVDFLHVDDLIAGGAKRYTAVYLGTPLMLPSAAAAALKAFVEGGGVLISEARPAWNDERGFANPRIPGAGLDEVFGARERLLRSGDIVTMNMAEGLTGALAPLAGQSVPGATFAESLDPLRDDVRVLARFEDGAPAMTSAPFGRGRATLIGTFPAAAFETDPDKHRAAGTLLQALVEDAGIRPDISIDGAPGLVEARILDAPGHTLVIAINHDEAPHRVTLTLPRTMPDGWRNLETEASVPTPEGKLTHDFAARDVLVMVRE